jgi:hypothetical protein
MCVYSMVLNDWMRKDSPNHIPGFEPYKPLPPVIDPQLAKQMLDVLKRLDEIDKKLGALDCKVNEKDKEKITTKLRRRAKVKKCDCA